MHNNPNPNPNPCPNRNPNSGPSLDPNPNPSPSSEPIIPNPNPKPKPNLNPYPNPYPNSNSNRMSYFSRLNPCIIIMRHLIEAKTGSSKAYNTAFLKRKIHFNTTTEYATKDSIPISTAQSLFSCQLN